MSPAGVCSQSPAAEDLLQGGHLLHLAFYPKRQLDPLSCTNSFVLANMNSESVISQYKIDRDESCYENYDPYFPDQPVVDLYLPTWAKLPVFKSKPAFIWAEDGGKRSSISYGELNAKVESMAAQLLTVPLHRGDIILILAYPGLDLVKVLFSCQRAGLLSVPISPPQILKHSNVDKVSHHLLRVLNQTKPIAAIAQRNYITSIYQNYTNSQADAHFAALLKGIKWLPIEGFVDHSIGRSIVVDNGNVVTSNRYSGCGADDVYLIQYTSGGTRNPKPVLVTAGSAAHNVRAARKAYDIHPYSIIHSWLPQYHDCGLMFLLLTVVAGATCVLASPFAFVHRPRFWLELLTEYGATCTPVPSFALPLVLKRGKSSSDQHLQLGKLNNLVLINEPIYASSVADFVEEFSKVGLSSSCISPSYGLAENCTFVSTSWRSQAPKKNIGTHMLNFPTYLKLLPSARLAPSYSPTSHDGIIEGGEDESDEIEVIIVDNETMVPVEDGVEGEIWVSSPSNASGYLGYPYLTREVFRPTSLGGKVIKNYVRTGDVGVVKGEERFLYVMGRISDRIKMKKTDGETKLLNCHYLETSAYESCPNLLRSGCIAAFQISPKMIVLMAELQKNAEQDEEKIKKMGINGSEEDSYKNDYQKICQMMNEFLVKEYGDVEVDILIILLKVGSIPKTTSGKIQRWAARDQLMRGELVAVKDIIGARRTLPWLLQTRNVNSDDLKGVGKQVVDFKIFFHDRNQLNVTPCLPSCL